MTCIIGLVQDGKVYMGADSRVGRGWEKRELDSATCKVFRKAGLLIGWAGMLRSGQLIEYMPPFPDQEKGMSDIAYLVTIVGEAMRVHLKTKGHSKVDNNQEEIPTDFLVGFQGRLYRVGPDFAVECSATEFDAIGSGGEVALGAMAALADWPPKKRIRRALEISAQFVPSVGGPFYVFNLPRYW